MEKTEFNHLAEARVIALPDRQQHLTDGLPSHFARSQIDAFPPALCLVGNDVVASCDAWGDRRLGLFTGEQWGEMPGPPGWLREPRSARDDAVLILCHSRAQESGTATTIHRGGHARVIGGRWGIGEVADVHDDVVVPKHPDGHARCFLPGGDLVDVLPGTAGEIFLSLPSGLIRLPKGTLVADLAVLESGALLAITLRKGTRCQVSVVETRGGRLVGEPLHRTVWGRATWLSESALVLLEERWPTLTPIIWDFRAGDVWDYTVSEVPAAFKTVVVNSTQIAFALSTPALPRALCTSLVEDVLRKNPAVLTVRTGTSRPIVISGPAGPIPCVWRPTTGRGSRGTFIMLAGGPQESVWPEFSPLADALNDLGWHVIQPNLRGCGLRSPLVAPGLSARYGVDDLEDVLAVCGVVPSDNIVFGGSSYGGYLAARAAAVHPKASAGVVLSGFFAFRDLSDSTHPQVQEFVRRVLPLETTDPVLPTVPLYVAHGSEDERLPISGVERWVARLDSPSEYVRLEGEGHAVRSDQAARETYPKLFEWLDCHACR